MIKIKILDIGCASGLIGELAFLYKINNLDITGIEPDKDSNEKTQENSNNRYKIINKAVSSKDSEMDFYITNEPQGCSLYEPNMDFIKGTDFEEALTLKKKIKIKTNKLDTLFKDESFDFIKIDAQGADHDIIMGGINLVKKCTGIIFEANFIELYKKQKTFSELHELMLSMGFIPISYDLRDMNGMMFEIGDAVYVKRDFKNFDKARLICSIYGSNYAEWKGITSKKRF